MSVRSSVILLFSMNLILLTAASCKPGINQDAGNTEILKWKDGKKAAVSITYDDGSINQFRVAVPLMEDLGFRGTFFINTGLIPGSEFHARFIGRPTQEIIQETANIPTNPENLFERASAVGFLGDVELMDYHTRAGAAVDAENMERAFRIIDDAYAQVRDGRIERSGTHTDYAGADRISWDEIRELAERGHEFASHTLSHPRLAVLDEVNLRWELEKCKEEIHNQLGPKHTFSCECPYGTENERVMDHALEIYPALRNRMPAAYLAELNRSSRQSPGAFEKPYVQWQRGPLSDTPLHRMNSWVDTCRAHDNIWLVLVIHGVEGVGWESIPGDTLERFFKTIKSSEQDLWVATFQDVTKYMRERMNARLETTRRKGLISVDLSHDLDPELYNQPLSLKTGLPDGWEALEVSQAGKELAHETVGDTHGKFVVYQAEPNTEPVIIQRLRN